MAALRCAMLAMTLSVALAFTPTMLTPLGMITTGGPGQCRRPKSTSISTRSTSRTCSARNSLLALFQDLMRSPGCGTAALAL